MDPEIFKHYLLTRFNLRKDDWKTSKNGSPVLTEAWLKNRFRLFEQFCLQSVQSQTNRNFTWLVFFDITTPAKYKEKISQYCLSFPSLKPVYIDGMSRFLPAVQNEIKKSASPYIITSRMDNDDCISKYFIHEVQECFDQQDYMAIDFADGYTLQVNPRVRAGKRKQVYNPFISLIEKNNNPQSVWCKQAHSSWKKEKHVKRVTHKRIWMSVIHAENKKNKFVGYGHIDLKALFDDFIIDKAVQSELIDKCVNISSWRLRSFTNRITSNWRTLYKDIKRGAGLYQ